MDILSFYSQHIKNFKPSTNNWYTGHCPFHEDGRASFAFETQTGNWRCHAGCGKGTLREFCNKAGTKYPFNGDTKKEAAAGTGSNITATYDYTDESGQVLFQSVRMEPKDFWQRRPDGKGGWIWNTQGVRLVPFNLPAVLNVETIFIVEGEKDCLTLATWGLTASTNPMGAGKWRAEYNQYFKNKTIIILPDNDDAGQKHAEQVANALNGTAAAIKKLALPGLEHKQDVTDWKAKGHTKEDLLRFVDECSPWTAGSIINLLKTGAELQQMECSVEWVIDKLLPKQSITLLHGMGGIGKTYLTLRIADAISKGSAFMGMLETRKLTAVYVDFENPLPMLVERTRKLGCEGVYFWHNSNEALKPEKLDKDWETYKKLPQGSLIIFDSLRASQDKDENSSQDMQLIMSRLKELRDAGNTILLIHHTPKGNERTYKGSTAIFDLADHVLALYKVKKNKPDEAIDSEEENDCYYRFGTKDKTRYEPYHIYLQFNPECGFEMAPDPDENDLRMLYDLMNQHAQLNQSKIVELAKVKGLTRNRISLLLRKGEGRVWTTSQGEKNAKLYTPKSVFQFSTPIYSQKTGKQTDDTEELPTRTPLENNTEIRIDSEFPSFPEGVKKTGKLEPILIDQAWEPVE